MIDFVLFRLWRWWLVFTPMQVRVYLRGEREFRAVPDFLAQYRKTVWAAMTPREQRFTKWLGWPTP